MLARDPASERRMLFTKWTGASLARSLSSIKGYNYSLVCQMWQRTGGNEITKLTLVG